MVLHHAMWGGSKSPLVHSIHGLYHDGKLEARMTNSTNSPTLKDFFLLFLAVLTFGVGYIVDHQDVVIGFIAIAIVWVLSQLGKLFPSLAWIKGKTLLTCLVFVASFILALVIKPMAWPTLPSWSGDIVVFAPLLAAFLAAFFANIQTAVLFALTVYPVLLAQVTDKLGSGITNYFISRRTINARIAHIQV